MPVSIQTITDSVSLFKYPQLQLVTVNNWKVVCNKNNFKLGNKVIYVGINSWISTNHTKYASILKPYLYGAGYWIRPIKMAGIVSSGLVLPMSLMDIQLQVKDYEQLPYPYLQDVLSSIVFNSKYNISKVSNKTSVIETNVRLDIKSLVSELTVYADSYNEEDEYCKGLAFNSLENGYNFYVTSTRYYMTQSNAPYDPNMSGDWEYVETGIEAKEEEEAPNPAIESTDGNVDIPNDDAVIEE